MSPGLSRIGWRSYVGQPTYGVRCSFFVCYAVTFFHYYNYVGRRCLLVIELSPISQFYRPKSLIFCYHMLLPHRLFSCSIPAASLFTAHRHSSRFQMVARLSRFVGYHDARHSSAFPHYSYHQFYYCQPVFQPTFFHRHFCACSLAFFVARHITIERFSIGRITSNIPVFMLVNTDIAHRIVVGFFTSPINSRRRRLPNAIIDLLYIYTYHTIPSRQRIPLHTLPTGIPEHALHSPLAEVHCPPFPPSPLSLPLRWHYCRHHAVANARFSTPVSLPSTFASLPQYETTSCPHIIPRAAVMPYQISPVSLLLIISWFHQH